MPVRDYRLDSGQKVRIVKSKRSKHLRISIGSNGLVRVSIPTWLPYRQGFEFATQKQDWISANSSASSLVLVEGQVGKAHQIVFLHEAINKTRSRISGNEIIIKVPLDAAFSSEGVQELARKACIRALKIEANNLLPIRLKQLAAKNGYQYKSLNIKHLKGRWGSCSNSKDIVLNCLLMQLTWQEIDYVILHELVHTTNMSHNKAFWSELESLVNNMRDIKKQIRSRRPILQSN